MFHADPPSHGPSRRQLLRNAGVTGAASVAAFVLPVWGSPQAMAATGPHAGSDPVLTPPPKGYSQTAADLTSAYVSAFWNRTGGNIFSAPQPGAETVASDAAHDNGYTFWPSIVGLHGLVEGEAQRPGSYAYWIWTVYSGLEQYWNPDLHCYMAWMMFPGNDDSYYDDNAWAVITLVAAGNATRTSDPQHAQTYLDRANDIMNNYEIFGWDSTSGGMKWGTSPSVPGTSDRTTSATAGAALAAFVLEQAGQSAQYVSSWTDWGTMALAWIQDNLEDTDHLVRDGIDAGGAVMTTKWTYNTGVTIRAFAERYRLTGNPNDLASANAMAYAAISHDSAMLMDSLVDDPGKRFWWDSTFFAQYLVDGLVQLAHVTDDSALRTAIANEVNREAAYTYNYIRDQFSGDGMYWRSLRLWTIGPYQDQVWEQLTGQTQALQQDPSEMSGTQYVKSLLGNAAVARMFWLLNTV